VRRIRHIGSLDELAATLLDSAMAFAAGAAILRIAGTIATGTANRPIPRGGAPFGRAASGIQVQCRRWSWTMVRLGYAGDRDFQIQGNMPGCA
jgi:hypothetical protein